MSIFVKKTWKDFAAQHPNRRRLTHVSDDLYDVELAVGGIIEEGNKFEANEFNDLEGRIESAFNSINTYIDRAETAATNAETSETNAANYSLKSEGYAIGKQNGVDVTQDSEYFENNAKWNKEQAYNYMVAAQGYSQDSSSYASSSSSSATSANSAKETAISNGLISEGFALGTQNGVPVGPDSPYYHNNSKWNKDHSQTTQITITPTLATGTKVAEFEINGVGGEIYAPEGGSGSGHVIEDKDGTELTQRDNLQFAGYLNTSDDSTNEVTVVDDSPTEVEYFVWLTMTAEQKIGTKWLIKNAPGGEGSGDATSIDGIPVTITNPTDKQLIGYDANTGELINMDAPSAGLLPHFIILSDEGSDVKVVGPAPSTDEIILEQITTEQWECDVPNYGSYTIHSILNGEDKQTVVNVTTCGKYTIDDSHFHASIVVTYPAGATVSCVKTGEPAQYATSSPYTFVVHSLGEYTITGTRNGITEVQTVTITASEQVVNITLTILPDGSTITPTDSVQILLNCADIWDKSYTAISELIADDTSLLKVLTTDNAIDYLVRSTTFATDITADSDAMAIIGSYDYCADTLLSDSTWATAIVESTYASSVINISTPQMTSDNAPSGVCSAKTTAGSSYPAWKAFDKDNSTLWASATNPSDDYLRYKFAKAVSIGFVKIKTIYSGSLRLKTLSIKASNDNFSTSETLMPTVTLTNQNVEDYLYTVSPSTKFDSYGIENLTTYQSDVEIKELDFLGRENGGVQSWLRAGGITDKDYTTLAEVLADTTTLSALIASQNAVDYLVTAKAFIDEIVADATAMSYIGLNNYCANTLLADADWCDGICNSAYFESVLNVKVPTMTSDTTPSGECYSTTPYSGYYSYYAFNGGSSGFYCNVTSGNTMYVAYRFPKAIKVCRVDFKGARVTASNGWKYSIGTNNDDYTDVYTGNGNADTTATLHSYSVKLASSTAKDTHKITITANANYPWFAEVQFYGREDV